MRRNDVPPCAVCGKRLAWMFRVGHLLCCSWWCADRAEERVGVAAVRWSR